MRLYSSHKSKVVTNKWHFHKNLGVWAAVTIRQCLLLRVRCFQELTRKYVMNCCLVWLRNRHSANNLVEGGGWGRVPGAWGGGVLDAWCLVAKILILFQIKWLPFLCLFSGLSLKIHSRFQARNVISCTGFAFVTSNQHFYFQFLPSFYLFPLKANGVKHVCALFCSSFS